MIFLQVSRNIRRQPDCRWTELRLEQYRLPRGGVYCYFGPLLLLAGSFLNKREAALSIDPGSVDARPSASVLYPLQTTFFVFVSRRAISRVPSLLTRLTAVCPVTSYVPRKRRIPK